MFEQAQGRAPPAELIRGLAVFAEPPTKEHGLLAEALGLPSTPTPSDYSDLFLFQLYPYASVHLGPEGMLGGEARARVAGFWRALGYDPPAEPDHLSAILGLYAALADRETATEAPAEARLIRESRVALLHEHLAPWVFAFLARVRELTDGPYAAWAGRLGAVLRDEVGAGREPSSDVGLPLPLHLRTAPPLPDPRVDGAAEFVSGLLAPVRSGVVLTRADLARIAALCDVGLRAGERRYALEHLLAQDGPAVLRALAEEARRQAGTHEERAAWLGGTARFFADRARATAQLLDVLSEDAGEDGAGGEVPPGGLGPPGTRSDRSGTP